MKKLFAVLLALALLLMVCGCEEKGASHEAPEPTDYEVVRNALLNDFEQAREQYIGAQIEWNIPMTRIEKEFSGGTVTDLCILLRTPTWYAESNIADFHIYLSQEELHSLEADQIVRIKGRMDEIWLKENKPQVEVKDASIVTDTFRISGEITYINTFRETPYCCFIDNSVIPIGACFIVFLPEGHGFSVGDTITMDTMLMGGRHEEGIAIGYDESLYKRTSMTFFLYEDDYTVVE